MNCHASANNLVRISSSTLTNTETSTGGCTKKLPREETIQAHTQPVLFLTPRLNRQKTAKSYGMTKRAINCQIYRNASMRPPEPINGTELQNTEWSLKFSKHQWKSTRQPTTKNPNHGGQHYNNYNNSYNNGKNNPQGSKNNSYKGKSTNGHKVQCKLCFGPREIFHIHKLLEENASNSEWYAETKVAKSTAKFNKNRNR